MKKAMQRIAAAALTKKIVVTVALALTVTIVHAQYSSNNQTITIDGVTSNWTGNYNVGNTTWGDLLIITNVGKLFDTGIGYLGNSSTSSIMPP